MFSGHFVATMNIMTRMTSGMIWTAVMECSGCGVAEGLKISPPSTSAINARNANPAAAASRIRRRVGRGASLSRVWSAATAVRCSVLVMIVSSAGGSREGGSDGAAGDLGEMDDGCGDGAGRAVDAYEERPVVLLAPGLDDPGGGAEPERAPQGVARDGVQHGAGGAGSQGQGDAAGDGQGRVGLAHGQHHDVGVAGGVGLG